MGSVIKGLLYPPLYMFLLLTSLPPMLTGQAHHTAQFLAKAPEDQSKRVRVGANVQVSRDRSEDRHFEVMIAADEKLPNRLLAASIVRISPTRDFCAAYTSEDGGKSWHLAYMPKPPPTKDFTVFDPAVAYGTQGEAYFVALFMAPVPGPHIPDYFMEITRSQDGGTVWDPPVRIPGFYDRPYVASDCSQGRFRGRLYINSGLHGGGHGVRTSEDQGKTFHFSSDARLQVHAPLQTLNMGQSVILSDGTLVMPYLYFTGRTGSKLGVSEQDAQETGVSVCRSMDGGASLITGKSQFAVCQHTPRDGMPNLATNARSARFKDRIYLVWSEVTLSGHCVMLSHSQDHGISWSSPVLISDQTNAQAKGMERRDALRLLSHYDAFLPSVAVNREGVVAVCWYDTRDTPTGKAGWDVRFRASLDGGVTWLPGVRVSEVTSLFAQGEDWAGDTAGMAADASGAFHPLWVDGRTGKPQVFTAIVEAPDTR